MHSRRLPTDSNAQHSRRRPVYNSGHDCRRVCSHRRHDETVANSLRVRVHTADATRLDSFVSSASAVCIGLKACCDCVGYVFCCQPVHWSTVRTSRTCSVWERVGWWMIVLSVRVWKADRCSVQSPSVKSHHPLTVPLHPPTISLQPAARFATVSYTLLI